MTTITVYALPGGILKGYEAVGHADGRRSGEYDLVCSAVSALTQTGVNALCAVAGITPEVIVRDGYLRCLLPEGQEAQEKAQIVLQTVLQGLNDVEQSYPKQLRMRQQEWRQADAYDESSALRA